MMGSCGTSGAVRLWSMESQRLLATLSPIHTGEYQTCTSTLYMYLAVHVFTVCKYIFQVRVLHVHVHVHYVLCT